MTKPFTILLLLLCLTSAAQKGDMAIHVAKPKIISFQPELSELHSGYSYDFLVMGISPSLVTKVESTMGNATCKTSKDGKALELKISVVGSASSSGTIKLIGDKNNLLATREYKIVSMIRYADYTPDQPGPGTLSPVILFLGKDTLSDNGTVSARKLHTANSLSLYDGNIPPAAIRRNLMCKITIIQDTSSLVAHSALNYLSDKVKQAFAKTKAGDRIYISAMETLWIDADRRDYISSYGRLTYTLAVTE